MALLEDIQLGAVNGDEPDKKIESVVKQLNEWGRTLSNEGLTQVYKDTAGDNRILIGMLPDGTCGIVISKPGYDVVEAFDA